MDVEQMKADLGPGAVFDIGEENTAFAQYFTGECYLKMLTTEGVSIGNVSFAPGTEPLAYPSQRRSNPTGDRRQRLVSGVGKRSAGAASG